MTDWLVYLQKALCLNPNLVNRAFSRLKRYFAWLVYTFHIKYDPTKMIKLVVEEVLISRQQDDHEEQ